LQEPNQTARSGLETVEGSRTRKKSALLFVDNGLEAHPSSTIESVVERISR
jgi:hypothetical protein